MAATPRGPGESCALGAWLDCDHGSECPSDSLEKVIQDPRSLNSEDGLSRVSHPHAGDV